MANYTDSGNMIYDLNKHRYILTPEAIQEVYGINLVDALDSDSDASPETLPDRFLERASKILYNYMYSWAEDKAATEYFLSLPRNREAIEEVQLEYVYSLLMNNTDPSIFFTGNALNAIEVPPNVQTILLNNGLIFRGRFYNLPQDYQKGRGVEY